MLSWRRSAQGASSSSPVQCQPAARARRATSAPARLDADLAHGWRGSRPPRAPCYRDGAPAAVRPCRCGRNAAARPRVNEPPLARSDAAAAAAAAVSQILQEEDGAVLLDIDTLKLERPVPPPPLPLPSCPTAQRMSAASQGGPGISNDGRSLEWGSGDL